MNKIKSISILAILLIIAFTLTGFSSLNMGVESSGAGQIAQEATPPAEPAPTEPAAEQPESEQPENESSSETNRIYIQLPGDDDASTSTQYFGAGMTLGCLIGLGVILLLIIGLLAGRGSRGSDTQTSASDNSSTMQ